MAAINYPALPPANRLSGKEVIGDESYCLATVQEFWEWAYSNVNDNASRGRLAEFIVAKALGCANGTRREWDPFDLEWNGIKIEVKSSGFIQTWAQRDLSRPLFDIKPTRCWSVESGEFEEELRRQADIYVFCLENCKNQEVGNPNPLDLDQWDFLVLATEQLNSLGSQKSVSYGRLIEIGARQVIDIQELPQVIMEVANIMSSKDQ